MTPAAEQADARYADALPPAGTVARRRLGLLLATFGGVGILLVATAFALLVVPGADGPFGIEGQRRQLVALLDESADAIDSAEAAARNADASLASTATAAASAAALMSQLSTTMDALAGSLRVTVLGSQPFALVADDMSGVAAQASTVSADLEVAASSVRLAAEDMVVLADDLSEMRGEIGRIRATMAEPIDLGNWRLLLAALLVWFAIPAAVSLWIGLRWLRPSGRRGAPSRAAAGHPRPAPRD